MGVRLRHRQIRRGRFHLGDNAGWTAKRNRHAIGQKLGGIQVQSRLEANLQDIGRSMDGPPIGAIGGHVDHLESDRVDPRMARRELTAMHMAIGVRPGRSVVLADEEKIGAGDGTDRHAESALWHGCLTVEVARRSSLWATSLALVERWDRVEVDVTVERAADAVECIATDGVDVAMNRFN